MNDSKVYLSDDMEFIPLVDLRKQYLLIRHEIDSAIRRVLESASFILGEEVSAFEQAFAQYVRVKDAVGVASGTSALHLALVACGIGEGDEVITTSHTFIATAEAILHAGAIPVFVDIDPVTFNIDPNQIEAAITERTRAIVPVHLYGRPADMGAIMEIAGRRNLFVIEDAAQAHGAEYNGERCGSIGHLGCFSFYPGKNLGAYGDAGAVTGDDPRLLAMVRELRDHGRKSKYLHSVVGYGERMDALHAAVLGVKLRHLEAWTEARRVRGARYTQQLGELSHSASLVPSGMRHVYHLYVIRSDQRDSLVAHLHRNGVAAGVHYPVPVHKQEALVRLGFTSASLPHTEEAARTVLSLPLYAELTFEQLDIVCKRVQTFVEAAASTKA